jgi:GTPase SAR1 family protein
MEMVNWNRSKIMLVGQGRAGKTALARSMMGEPFVETPSTIGGEFLELEIREGNVKGGTLAEHKRPEKELEWIVARNGMLHEMKQKRRVRELHKTDPSTLANLNNAPHAVLGENDDVQDEQDARKSEGSPTSTMKEGEKPIINLNRDIMYRLVTRMNRMTANNLSKLTISLCDFGGQDVFNALHAFFMTRCGVYMLVFDMELFLSKEEKDRESCHENIKFWMNSIAMHTYDETTGKTAPVALVGTRKDKISSVEEHERISSELKERYENHRVWPSLIGYHLELSGWFSPTESKPMHFLPVNNNKGYLESWTMDPTLQQLLYKTQEKAMESEEVKREIPLIWMKALDEIREKGKKENKSFLWFEEVTDIAEKLGISLEGVSELLRYLYEMGVLIWIDEPGLREIVILDPIEYFVKPVTRIICKHLASKKDPYATKHELPIHKECQKLEERVSEDWKLMLEFGMVSDKLARRLLTNKTVDNIDGLPEQTVEKLLLLMERYGLMVPALLEGVNHASTEPYLPRERHYFVPSLVPDDPDSIVISENNREEQELAARLRLRSTSLSQFRSSATVFLSFSLPTTAKDNFQLFSYAKVKRNGFLPNGLFDRFIARILSTLPDLVVKSNDTRFIAFKDMMRIDCNGKLIRLTNHFHQNMIKIEIEEGNSVSDLMGLVEEWLEVVKKLIRECYKCLKVTLLLPVDCEEGKNGLISLEGMLNKQQSMMPEYISEDGYCRLTRAKFIELQSKWSSPNLPVPPLTNPSHIMFSYCWGYKKDHVIAMEKKLREKGYDIWRDENGSSIVPPLAGDTDESMARAVEKSSLIIIFVSKAYYNSANCKKEAQYCSQKRKPLLFVMLDENYHTGSSPEAVEGWLGLLVGTQLWYSLWKLDQLESTSSAIASRIEFPVVVAPVTLSVTSTQRRNIVFIVLLVILFFGYFLWQYNLLSFK